MSRGSSSTVHSYFGSGFTNLMSVARGPATIVAYCSLPSFLSLSGVPSQQVIATKASASCAAKAFVAALRNLASSTGEAARTDRTGGEPTTAKARMNVFMVLRFVLIVIFLWAISVGQIQCFWSG